MVKESLIVPNKYKILPKYRQVSLVEETNKIAYPYVGDGARNPFLEYDAGARLAMADKQKTKTIPISNPESPPVLTGLEYEVADYSSRIEIPANVEILDVIEEFSGMEVISVTYCYREENGKRGMRTVQLFDSHDSYFGYELKLTKEALSLRKGGYTKEGEPTVLARGPSIDRGVSTTTVNAKVVNLSHIGCSKDALVVSEGLLKRMAYKTYRSISFGVTNRDVLYNVYGTLDNYAPLPTVGQPVNPYGYIIGMVRVVDPAQLSKRALTDPDLMLLGGTLYQHDGLIESSKVKTLRVYRTSNRVKRNPLNAPLFEASSDITDYNKALKHNLDGNGRLSNEAHNAMKKIHALEDGSTKVLFGDENYDFVIELVVETSHIPTIKDKICTDHGSKGLVSTVLKDEMMPYDKRGRRCDIIIDSTAMQRRMVMGNKYEGYIFDNADWMADKFIKDLETKSVKDVKKDVIEYLSLYDNTELIGIFNRATDKDFVEYIRKDRLKPVINVYDGVSTPYAIIRRIQNSKFATPLTGLYIPVEDGEDIFVQQFIATEVNKLYLHYKNGESWQGVPTTFINPLGGVVSPNKLIKKTYSYNVSPLRAFSESEIRLLMQMGDDIVKFVKRVRTHSTSQKAQCQLIRTLIRSEDCIEVSVEDTAKIFDNALDVPPAMFEGLLRTFGIVINKQNLKYPKKPDNVLP